jgi:hypothetical protein
MIFDSKEIECNPNGCGTLFAAPKSHNDIQHEFKHHHILSYTKTLEDSQIYYEDALKILDEVKKQFPKNRFNLVKLKEESEVIHYEIQKEILEGIVKEGGVYIILLCPTCNKEAMRVRK